MRRAAILLIIAALAARAEVGCSERPPDPVAESQAQFGLHTRSERRWRRERPTPRNVQGMSEAGLIERLSKRVWADRGLRKLRAARPGND